MAIRQRLCALALVIIVCVATLTAGLAGAQGDLTLRFTSVNSQAFPDIETTVTVVSISGKA